MHLSVSLSLLSIVCVPAVCPLEMLREESCKSSCLICAHANQSLVKQRPSAKDKEELIWKEKRDTERNTTATTEAEGDQSQLVHLFRPFFVLSLVHILSVDFCHSLLRFGCCLSLSLSLLWEAFCCFSIVCEHKLFGKSHEMSCALWCLLSLYSRLYFDNNNKSTNDKGERKEKKADRVTS